MLAGEEPIRWLFTGDSITEGAKHTMGWRDYVELFSERRAEMARHRDFVIKTGIGGWNIWEIARDLDWNVLQFAPHVVSINVGMNDCKGGEERLPDFRATYLDVVDRIRTETGAAIIIHTPNRSLVTGGPNRVEYLPGYVGAVREVAAETGAVLVDHYEHWQPYEENGMMHEWIGHGCHPNQYGHRAMAHLLLREIGIWDDDSRTCQLFVPRK